ncbi:MAG TPA: sigma-70 family RNA polymerase sigma factor [Rhodothermales bacterium]|nr:sigma-70 family RNA polymerase sigma factor [Rhodothermales bacterium]
MVRSRTTDLLGSVASTTATPVADPRPLLSAMTDEQLVQRYLEGGHQDAFRLLVVRHQERIFGYLLGMVRDREVANDLFQETFLRVVAAMQRERASYTHQDRWLPWVMRIARNAALDHLRSRKKWQDVSNGEGDDETSFWDRLADHEADLADELLHESERSGFLNACIAQLPPEQREVLLMRHESELTFREIAEITDVSINTALGRMRYALLNLRKMMTKAGKDQYTEYGA